MVGETLAHTPGPKSLPSLRIYLAGGIALRARGGSTVGEDAFAGRQSRRLFVRLVVTREAVPQAELADDLWGDEWPPSWQLSLRALMSKTRGTLARVGVPDGISTADGTYALRLPAGSWIDLDAASEAIHVAETARADGDLQAALGWALAARAISSRPLLPGEEAEWLETLRRRLAETRLRALECLAEVWIAHGDHALAARDAAEAIAIDPFRESAHRLLIRAHLEARDRGAAALALAACRRILHEELGVTPSPATIGLLAHSPQTRDW